jgi:hypothetical protein
MSKKSVLGKHFGVIAAAIDLQIRAAGQRCAHLQHQFPGFCDRQRNALYAQIFLAAQNAGEHRGVGAQSHPSIFSLPAQKIALPWAS